MASLLKSRIDGLSDGIFAIVMTLLVIEIRVPELHGDISSSALLRAVFELQDLYLSYALSFVVLFVYWVSHHYVVSVYAQSVDRNLLYLNLPYFLFVGLVPFSSHLLGAYPDVPFAIWWYGVNVMLIGFSGLWILHYVQRADAIENQPIDPIDLHYAYIRGAFPIVTAAFAIALSLFNTRISLIVFILALIVQLIPGTIAFLDRVFISRLHPHAH